MSQPAHVGDVLGLNARLNPDKIGARDLERAMTFRQWHARSHLCSCARVSSRSSRLPNK